jgi:hypothetical protein
MTSHEPYPAQSGRRVLRHRRRALRRHGLDPLERRRPLAGGFLAFERRRHERRGYAVLARETQALRIEIAHGSMECASPDDAFDADVVAWWHAEKVEQEPTLGIGVTLLHGLLPGRDLVAFGVALASATPGEPRRFAAEAVAAGTIAGYREKLAAEADRAGWPLYVSGGASLLLFSSTVRQARRLLGRGSVR